MVLSDSSKLSISYQNTSASSLSVLHHHVFDGLYEPTPLMINLL